MPNLERRVMLPEPSWSRGSGSYVAIHPTNYRLRADVRKLALKYLNHPELKGKISINTYLNHPPGWNRDTTSFDVWGWGGRGFALSPELRRKVFSIIFDDPSEPLIWWIISGGGMWTPYGWEDAPWGPAGSDPDHIYHIHVTYF
jgi:hypothetical protein